MRGEVSFRCFNNNGDIFALPNLKFSLVRSFMVVFVENFCEGAEFAGLV
jgi:hypothetical protein